MSDASHQHTDLIAVDAITVVNPRIRNPKIFDEIVANIAELGLKRPITVAARNNETNGSQTYELVCGQGRLEAFKVLKQQKIPAVVITASSEDCLVMSLVENLARRQHHSLDLLSSYPPNTCTVSFDCWKAMNTDFYALLKAGKSPSASRSTLQMRTTSTCKQFYAKPMNANSCAAVAF